MPPAARTVLLVAVVLVPAGFLGVALARRLANPVQATAAVPEQTAVASGKTAATPSTSGRGVKVQLSDKPVALPAMALKDLSGKSIGPADWRGKVVLLNFWATWCGPCRAEIPMLVALQDQYRDQLVIVGMSIDEGPADTVQQFIRGYGVNYPVAVVGPELQKAFGGISSVPLTFVVKPDGGIVQRHVGLLNPALTEHEVRVLAGLPSEAAVEVVHDTGQLLAANAAYATEIPGVSFAGLTSKQKAEALNRLNTEHCSCGCGLTLAQCRIQDPSCTVSPPLAQKLVASIRGR